MRSVRKEAVVSPSDRSPGSGGGGSEEAVVMIIQFQALIDDLA